MSYTLYPTQEKALEKLYTMRSAVIACQPGMGKCKDPESRVLTNKGYIRLKDFVSDPKEGVTNISSFGIKASTRKGEKLVTNFYYEKDCILRYLKLSNGVEINGTFPHRVLIENEDGEIVWSMFKDIKEGDIILYSDNSKHFETSTFIEDVSNDDLYVLGLWLGNGSGHLVTTKTETYLQCRLDNRPEPIEYIKSSHPDWFGKITKKNKIVTVYFRKTLNDKFSKWLCNTHITSKDKYIPNFVFKGSFEQKLYFLYGLADSDATFNPTLEWCQKSRDLVDGIQYLLESMGIFFKRAEKKITSGKYKGNIYYRISVYKESLYKFLSLDLPYSRINKQIKDYINFSKGSFVNNADFVYLNRGWKEKNLPIIKSLISEVRSERNGRSIRDIYNKMRQENRKFFSKALLKEIFQDKYNFPLLDYKPIKVLSIRDAISDVMDIEVEEEHEYLSQGVINHNTITTLHLAKHLQEKEAVCTIFCIPKSARAAFEKELKTKLEVPYLMINSDTPLEDTSTLYRYSFIFIEFSVLGNYIDALVELTKINPSYIFIDEAHALCSPKSAQTTYMRMIRQNCRGCYSITASPLMTSIEGLFHLYNFTFPTVRIFQSWFKFRNQYCITQDRTIRMMGKKRIIKEIVGYKNMEELNSILDRITIKGFIEYNVDYQFRKVPLDDGRLEQYKLAAKGLLVTEEEKEWGPRLHDLQRVVDGLPQNDETVKEYNKTRLLIDTVKEIMNRNEAVLIYVEYMDTIDYLKEILSNHKEDLQYNSIMVLSGQEKEEKRQEIEKTLIARDIVIITKAGRQCFGKGTEILMADGTIKKVEDIIVGDKVMGMDSKPRIVRELHSGIDNLYRVNQNKSCSYIVNSEHILTLRNTVRDKVKINGSLYGHKDMLDINVKDYLGLSKYKRTVFRGFKEGFTGELLPLPIPPYILGIWLGDGTRKRPEITINKQDIGIYESWKEYGSSLGLEASIECVGKGSFRSCLTSHINGKRNKFTELLREVIGDNKHIPEVYLLSSRSQRLELLAGLIDTDGSKHREGLAYSTVNEDLAFAVKRLCDGLGYHTSINKKHKTNGYKETDIYILGISGYFDDLPLRVKRKIPQIRNNKTDYSASSLRIEPIGVGEFYGFEIEGDPHFQLADGTIVHNSRNLQRANNLIMYNTPYSLSDFIQLSGRICRVDTTFSQQHFYILEVDRTIDSYRIALFKDHLSLLDRLLGKECRGTLTCDYVEIDRMKMKDLKKSLLWRTK